MSRKYVGLDVHQSTTTMAVCSADGSFLFDEMHLSTESEAILTAIRSLDGDVSVAFEETTLAHWLFEQLENEVNDLVVCHPSDLPKSRESKTDVNDARRLAKYLRLGELTAVYHGSGVDRTLKQHVKTYDKLVDNLVRAKNRLKATFRKRNIDCPGKKIFQPAKRQKWLQKLDDAPAAKMAATAYLEQIDVFDKQRSEIRDAMVTQAKEHDGWNSLTSIPGFGSVRASRLMGILGTPWRFRTKRQLWRYSGLAVKIHDSSQYSIEGEDGIEHRRKVQTRGLNKDGNPRMKDIYKSAAETAVHYYTEVKEDFQARCFEKSPNLAKLDIARKLASQSLTLWKRQEAYDETKARWKTRSSAG